MIRNHKNYDQAKSEYDDRMEEQEMINMVNGITPPKPFNNKVIHAVTPDE
jgi:hypothetical protein